MVKCDLTDVPPVPRERCPQPRRLELCPRGCTRARGHNDLDCVVALLGYLRTAPGSHRDHHHRVRRRQTCLTQLLTVWFGVVHVTLVTEERRRAGCRPGVSSPALPPHLGKTEGLHKLTAGLGRPRDKGNDHKVENLNFQASKYFIFK